MLEQLKESQIKLGIHILRNDLVSSAWLEDRVRTEEKLESFLFSWQKEEDKSKFIIVL